MEPNNGGASSNSVEGNFNLPAGTKSKKKKKQRLRQPGGRLPLEVVCKSLEKFQEHFCLQHKTTDASQMSEDEQRNIISDFRRKKLWEDLQLLRDKSRGRDYISKRAEEIRQQYNNLELRKIVAGKLWELKFATPIIKSWYPEFRIKQQLHTAPTVTVHLNPTETIESASAVTVTTTSPTLATITTTTVTSSTFTTASSPTTTTETLSPTPVTTITTPSLPPSQTTTTTTTPTLSPSPTTTTTTTTPSSSPSQIETTNTTTTPTLSPTAATNNPTPSSFPSPTTTNTSTPPSRAAQIKINKNVPLIQNSTSSSTSILNDSTIHIPQETKTVSGIVESEISPVAPERRLNGDSPEFQSLEMMSQDKNTNEDENSNNQNFLDSYYSFHDSDSDTADQNSIVNGQWICLNNPSRVFRCQSI